MRARLVVIVLAWRSWPLLRSRYDAQARTGQQQSTAASGQLADAVSPEPAASAIITATVSTSATVQTFLVVESRRRLSASLSVVTASPHLPVVAHSSGQARFFPLLI